MAPAKKSRLRHRNTGAGSFFFGNFIDETLFLLTTYFKFNFLFSVPDVEPDAFLSLLKYLYCDEIQLEPDSVLATLYAAKKYIVPHLARECVKYLETSLSGISY